MPARHSFRHGVSVGAVLLAGGLSTRALAGNGLHVRTPVVWEENPQCMEVVDRSVDPVYTFSYDIPFEDTDVTPEEVDDSRTHQFFATCRQVSPQESFPGWISVADVEAAQLNYDDVDPDPALVFETSTAWEGCWHRITEDADRRPITFEMASMPVQWDTSQVPEGVYRIWGYTHEPVFNLWTPRIENIVRVFDGGDPAAPGPAAAITSKVDTPCVGQVVPIRGCVSARGGSTMTGYYAVTSGPGTNDPDWEPTWVPFSEALPVQGDMFTVDWVAPVDAAGDSVMLRIDVTDPEGNTYTAHQHDLNFVLAEGSPGCSSEDECDGSFIDNPDCETTGDASGTGDAGSTGTDAPTSGTTDAGSADTTGTGSAGGDDPEPSGCGCRSQGPDRGARWPGISGLLGGLLGLVSLRRRG